MGVKSFTPFNVIDDTDPFADVKLNIFLFAVADVRGVDDVRVVALTVPLLFPLPDIVNDSNDIGDQRNRFIFLNRFPDDEMAEVRSVLEVNDELNELLAVL